MILDSAKRWPSGRRFSATWWPGGLRGVQLVISDAHTGLQAAIRQVLQGASWQCCRVHFMRNLLVHVPKPAQRLVGAVLMEYNDEWAAFPRRYFSHTSMEKLRSDADASESLPEGHKQLA